MRRVRYKHILRPFKYTGTCEVPRGRRTDVVLKSGTMQCSLVSVGITLGLIVGGLLGIIYHRILSGVIFGGLLSFMFVLIFIRLIRSCTCGISYIVACILIICSVLILLTSFRHRQYTFYNTLDLMIYAMNIPRRTFDIGNVLTATGNFEDRVSHTGLNRLFLPPDMDVQMIDDAFNLTGTFKKNSVPLFIRDVALPRSSWGRGFNGNSVFVTNVADRGENNKLKRIYMAAFTGPKIQTYMNMITPTVEQCAHDVHACTADPDTLCVHVVIRNCVREIVFKIHTETDMVWNSTDHDFWTSAINAFNAVNELDSLGDLLWTTDALWAHIAKHDNYMTHLDTHISNAIFQGIFADWVSKGMTKKDVTVEYLHNIFAAGIQWTHLLERLLIHLPFNDMSSEWIYEFLRTDPITAFIISSTTETGIVGSDTSKPSHVLHMMRPIMAAYGDMKKSRLVGKTITCPVTGQSITTPRGANVEAGTSIIEAPGNWAFGRGKRRCAGEVITIQLVKLWMTTFQEKHSSLTYQRQGVAGTLGFGSIWNSTVM